MKIGEIFSPTVLKDTLTIITGAGRGLGRALALALAQAGSDLVLVARHQDEINRTADEVKIVGANVMTVKADLTQQDEIDRMVQTTMSRFGKIDVLVNNASVFMLTGTLATPVKRFDLMFGVNVRGTFACSQACIPHLMKAANPHSLNLSPPLSINAKWFKNHAAYTMSKYGMSMCTLGMSAELVEQGIAVNSLWPRTTIATAAIEVNFPAEILGASRKPAIMADAAYVIFNRDSRRYTGMF